MGYDHKNEKRASISCYYLKGFYILKKVQQIFNKLALLQLLKVLNKKYLREIVKNSLIIIYFHQEMSQKLLDVISKASTQTKNNISEFLKNLFKPEQNEEINHDQSTVLEIFNRNTLDMPITKARQLSKDQRSQRMLANHQFNYGEINFHTVYQIFHKIKSLRKIKQKQIFYDLGSGTGKVVFAAALCFPFIKCIGIQLLQSLYKFSKSLQEKVQSQREKIQIQIKNWRQQFQFPNIQFLNADFKQTDWCDGTIIFVSSTCYSKQVMNEIEKLCEKLEKGTIVVTLTRKLQNVHGLSLKIAFEGSTSWGSSTIYVHMKQL